MKLAFIKINNANRKKEFYKITFINKSHTTTFLQAYILFKNIKHIYFYNSVMCKLTIMKNKNKQSLNKYTQTNL
jgi:hypothetical protein